MGDLVSKKNVGGGIATMAARTTIGNSTSLEPADVPSSLYPSSLDAMKQIKPFPLSNSLTASAARITGSRLGRIKKTVQSEWQEDAWDMYDLVGEQRFLANTLANRCSQSRLYIGRVTGNDTEPPIPIPDDDPLNEVLEALGGNASGRAQMLRRWALSLFIVGEGWLVGYPRDLDPDENGPIIDKNAPPSPAGKNGLADYKWAALSTAEVAVKGDKVAIKLGSAGDTVEVSPERIRLIRLWRPHPKEAWRADSPTRSSLPVLRELVGLTQHVSAQVDSRLAGAGLFIIPASAASAFASAGDGMQDPDAPLRTPEQIGVDNFTNALLDSMMTPIADRGSASAIVPLVITAPDETVEKFKHISFSTDLDEQAKDMRDEAIRRLALGQDAPPELLLGNGSLNHWGAWLVREDVVTSHLEPPLALICDALTTQFLWPILKESEIPLDGDVEDYVIWYDVSHMIVRPNRGSDALLLFDRGIIGAEAVRDAQGFEESDSPEAEQERMQEHGEESEAISPAREKALDAALRMVQSAPTVLNTISLAELVEQIEALLTGAAEDPDQPTGEGGITAPVEADGTIPDTDGDAMEVSNE